MTVAAVILAAGEGTRLRPLTSIRPKALCPVGNVPLLDHALSRVAGLRLPVAVNACYLAEQVVAHVDGRAFVSVEPGSPWGTAGGVARLRGWIAGRGVLVGNADAYLRSDLPPGADIAALLDGWTGDTVRVLGVPGGREFGDHRFAGFSLLPWDVVAALPVERGELVHLAWRPAERAGRLEVVPYPGIYLDTGTPAAYLAANLDLAAGGTLVAAGATVTGPVCRAVIGAGATVAGEVSDAVVWPGGVVAAGERLARAVRVGTEMTVPADTMKQL